MAQVVGLPDSLVDQVNAVFAMTQHQKGFGLEGQNLSADLAADTTARTCYQHGLSSKIGCDLGQVDLGRWAAQQVLDRDVAQLRAEKAPFEEILHAGQGAEAHQGVAADPDEKDKIQCTFVWHEFSGLRIKKAGFQPHFHDAFS